MRCLSGNKLYRYPDEIDPSLWKKAVELERNASSASPSLNEQVYNGAKEAGTQDAAEQARIVEGQDVLLVGWYGPDDPEVNISLRA